MASPARKLAKEMDELRVDIEGLQRLYDERKEALLAILKQEGRKREGSYVVKVKKTLRIADRYKAEAWTKENYPHLFRVDLPSVTKVLRGDVPDGFSVKETEYITPIATQRDLED